MKLKWFLKSTLEKLSGHQVWLEPASNPDDVRQFIHQLAPVAIAQPLIRLGGDDDGGYLAPDDLDGIHAVVSPGVSTEVSFDLSMAERGMDIYMADASVEGPPISHPRFHFQKKFLDVFDDANNIRLDSLSAYMAPEHSGDRLLQMDIEGAEYRVLLDGSDGVLNSFRIMLIEFHQLDRMYGDFAFRMIRATFQKLLRTHTIVHIHPNNICPPRIRGDIAIPPVMEFTFYRKDRAQIEHDRKPEFPNPLDRDNITHALGYELPDCWR